MYNAVVIWTNDLTTLEQPEPQPETTA